jgi:6-phosphogluconolactonase
MEISILPDLPAVSQKAAETFVQTGNRAIELNGKFTVALAGGSTPKSLYQLLTTDNFKARIDWTKAFFFFGDERNVPPTDGESNFRMANENLLKPLRVAEKNIFRWQTELVAPEKIAENYQKTIEEFFELKENEFPRFDLILLGIGGDGHTASLFPLTDALKENEKIAVANRVEKLKTTRLTLTYPTIKNASNIIFLASGAEKAETLQKVLEGEFRPDEFPAQNVKPENGELLWLIDIQAAQFLK